ncbi:MAG TPA: MGMT family protein [Xanthomonadaceae bacterium]|jgi:methylated-DNA-protein-cysteine methyltransferase-like protein|nr:MGMT family protein [Xanthomonadaceae bacterium]
MPPESARAKPGPAKTVSAKAAIARIHAAIRAIPVGQVAGYGVIARRAKLPGRARLVARVLSNNIDPTLPWHRVLRSDGRIAFPADSDGHAEQTQRLRAEGVIVEAGRVRGMPRAADNLDKLIWAPPHR